MTIYRQKQMRKNMMKQTANRLLALLLAMMMTLSLAACGKAPQPGGVTLPVQDGATIGQGSKTITVEVTDAEGKTVRFTVRTDQETVGAALQELGVVAGEQSSYGLYIKSVNGITADYDKDGVYWAFYIDGEYASTGADQTGITDGSVYAFRVEK